MKTPLFFLLALVSSVSLADVPRVRPHVLRHTTRASDVFTTPSQSVSPAESRGDSATDAMRSGNAGPRPSDNGNFAPTPINSSEHGNNGTSGVADYRPGISTGVSPGTGTTNSRATTGEPDAQAVEKTTSRSQPKTSVNR